MALRTNTADFHGRLRYFTRLYGRTASLLLTIGAGILVPQAQALSFLIQYLLFAMLFLAFLGLKIDRRDLHPSLLLVLLANLAVAFGGYFLFRGTDQTLALAAFITGLSPTAISAPVIAGFLERRVEYVVAAVLLTNLTIALIVPFALPWVVGGQVTISILNVLRSVVLVVFIPLGLAFLVDRLPKAAQHPVKRLKPYSFALWLMTLFLVISKSADFILYKLSVSGWTLLKIASISLVICAVNFSLGALIGGRKFRHEASQALGQKNLAFSIWLALTFVNPVVALGPTFYIVFHNVYNSLQLFAFARRRNRPGRPPRLPDAPMANKCTPPV